MLSRDALCRLRQRNLATSHLRVSFAQQGELVVPSIGRDAVQVVGSRALDAPADKEHKKTNKKNKFQTREQNRTTAVVA